MENHDSNRSIFVRLLCSLLFLSCLFNGQSQKIQNNIIQGNAKFAAGKTIRLITFEDLITYRPVVAASDVIDKDGNFKLEFPCREIQLAQIAINTSKAELYIEPGKNFNFSIEMDPQLFQLLDPMEYGGFLQIRNLDTTQKADINPKINRFEYVMDRISANYYDEITTNPANVNFDTITSTIEKIFPLRYSPTDFYLSYLYYSFASFERLYLQKYQDSLYHKYLDNEYILYNNPAYMAFFTDFYDNYLYTSSHIKKQNLIDCINKEGNYLSLFNEVGKDARLVNEKIRELVILQNMIQLYDNTDFSQKNILSIIEEIAQTTHFSEHKVIAQNVLYEIKHLRAGATVPTPDFRTENGNHFKINRLQGKWVYIQFFNTTCSDCIREMLVIKELQNKYGEQIAFVSVSLDFNVNLFIQFKDYYRQFDWQFAHFNDQFDWLNELQITTLPDNLLIAPDGTLAQRYAPDITRELPSFLARLFREKDPQIDILSPHNKN